MNSSTENYIAEMPADAGLASASFERMTDEEQASALESATKVINRHARVPQRAENLHIFPAVMSTDAVDSHFSRMHESSLKNYATDAGKGVPFMNSHRTSAYGGAELPLGHTYEGTFDAPETGGAKKARAGIYMLRGHSPNGSAGVSTDDMMRSIDAGTTRDGSVGFYGGKSICDICGNDVRDYRKCPHVPGTARETDNGKVATYTVQNAHLREFSGVYAGSTPGAMFSRAALDKTERAIVDHLVGPAEVGYLEEHYRLALSPSRTFISVPGKTDTEQQRGASTEMKAKELIDGVLTRSLAHLPETARKTLEDLRAKTGDDETDSAPALAVICDALRAGHEHADILAAFRAAGVDTLETARALKASGEDGKQYRVDLIEETLALGVKGHGESFNRELYSKLLAEPTRTLSDIKDVRAQFEKAAKERLSGLDADGNATGTGGRQTEPLHGFDAVAGQGGQASAKKPTGSARNFKTNRR